MIPSVAASERGGAQTGSFGFRGCRTFKREQLFRRSGLERPTVGGNSPVAEKERDPERILSSAGHGKPRMKQAGPSAKAKYSLATDSEAVP